jgi:hypothetical protein
LFPHTLPLSPYGAVCQFATGVAAVGIPSSVPSLTLDEEVGPGGWWSRKSTLAKWLLALGALLVVIAAIAIPVGIVTVPAAAA